MKKQTLAVVVGVMTLFTMPLASYASTYGYITSSGMMGSVVANTPDQALLVAPNIDPHSGVILLTAVNAAIMSHFVPAMIF